MHYYRFQNSFACLEEPYEELPEGYVELTEEEYNEQLSAFEQSFMRPFANNKQRERIIELKKLLASTDYQAIKYAEGWISEQDYAPIKAQRQAWREEINQLEAAINNGQDK